MRQRLLEGRPDDSASKSDRRASGVIFGNTVNEQTNSSEGKKTYEIVTHCLEICRA